ncbi:MAG: DNA repair protein RadA [candidate division Zixibacteria bacterium]|nr:DNA repair protein RadA [candidate division Zixibacteria bacterium]
MSPADKLKTIYICQNCGSSFPKWMGKCQDCGSWNSLTEEKVSRRKEKAIEKRGFRTAPLPLSQVKFGDEDRIRTGIDELDRVLGGGIVKDSAVLVGGDPGIGKSTLLLQASQRVAERLGRVLYITGEESLRQVKLRALRMGIDSDKIEILAETDLDVILNTLEENPPCISVVDSIQTTYSSELESPQGSVSQIRECASKLISLAKSKGVAVFIVGHVTKDGSIAGPRVLEHMVDTVLYFEGEKNYAYRILRSVKNRFGSSNEIGVFQMEEKGLVEVSNPSELFLSELGEDASGSVVVCSLEGSRPLLLELQALVSPSVYGMPQRVCSGIDYKRLSLLLAILEKRESLRVSSSDIFINVAGGVWIDEPAIDLGVVTAVVSNFKDIPVNRETLIMGEVGLGGEVRSINQIEKRIREGERLGFKRCVIPEGNSRNLKGKFRIGIEGVTNLKEALSILFKKSKV